MVLGVVPHTFVADPEAWIYLVRLLQYAAVMARLHVVVTYLWQRQTAACQVVECCCRRARRRAAVAARCRSRAARHRAVTAARCASRWVLVRAVLEVVCRWALARHLRQRAAACRFWRVMVCRAAMCLCTLVRALRRVMAVRCRCRVVRATLARVVLYRFHLPRGVHLARADRFRLTLAMLFQIRPALFPLLLALLRVVLVVQCALLLAMVQA